MKRRSVVLLAVLALAAGLRFAGIGFGLPLELRPDEEVFRVSVARMAETGDLKPHRFEYGGALFHVLYGVTRAVHAAARLVDPAAAGSFAEFARRKSAVIPIQRALSAFLGVATVLLAWIAGRRLGSDAGGLVAAALLAVLFLAVRDAHFGTVDVAAAFASMAALVAILRAGASGSRGAFVLAGLLCGLAVAVRYVPAVLALPLWLAAWRSDRAAGMGLARAAVGPRVLLAAAAMIAGAVLGAPYCILAFDEFRTGFQGAFFVGGRSSFDPLARLRELALTSLPQAADWPFTIAAAVAALVALFGRNPGARVLAVFVAAYLVALAAGTNLYLRWINPILPPLCVLVGWAVARPAAAWRHGAAWCAVVALAIGALPAARSVAIDRLFLRDTTFQQAARFLAERVPPGALIVSPAPGVASILKPAVAFAPWLSTGDAEWWAVVPRHPFPAIGRDPGWTSVVLAAAGDAERVAFFPAFSGTDWSEVEFEPRDWFFYPLRGFSVVDRAGPDLEVIRVPPRGVETRASGPPPPAPVVDVRPASIHVELHAPFGVDVLGFYVRFATESDAARGVFLGPFACGREPLDLPLTPAIRGRYVVQAATVAPSGIGPWSAPVPVVIE